MTINRFVAARPCSFDLDNDALRRAPAGLKIVVEMPGLHVSAAAGPARGAAYLCSSKGSPAEGLPLSVWAIFLHFQYERGPETHL
jgi:hypothetical protein